MWWSKGSALGPWSEILVKKANGDALQSVTLLPLGGDVPRAAVLCGGVDRKLHVFLVPLFPTGECTSIRLDGHEDWIRCMDCCVVSLGVKQSLQDALVASLKEALRAAQGVAA